MQERTLTTIVVVAEPPAGASQEDKKRAIAKATAKTATTLTTDALSELIREGADLGSKISSITLKGPGQLAEFGFTFTKEEDNGATKYEALIAGVDEVVTGATAELALEALVLRTIALVPGVVIGTGTTVTVFFGVAIVGIGYGVCNELSPEACPDLRAGELISNLWADVKGVIAARETQRNLDGPADLFINRDLFPDSAGALDRLREQNLGELLVCTGDYLPAFNQIDSPVIGSRISDKQSEAIALEFAVALKNGRIDPNTPPVPVLRPNTAVDVVGNDGLKKSFEAVDGDPDEIVADVFEGHATLSGAGIFRGVDSSGQMIAMVDSSATVPINDPTNGPMVVSAQQFFRMIGNRVESFSNYLQATIQDAIKSTQSAAQKFDQGASSQLIAQVISGLIQGQDIEDIAQQMAAQMVAQVSVEKLSEVLTSTKTDKIKLFELLKNNPSSLPVEAAKDAIVAVAITAILNGRDANREDYIRAAANASVQRVIRSGVNNLLEKEAFTKLFGNNNAIVGSGAAAGLISLASTLLNGQDIDEDALRAAATATGIAATASAIAVYAFSASPGGPVAMVIGAVLGIVTVTLFPSGGEKVYSNQSIGSVTQIKPDGSGKIIIGVREAGALIRAEAGQDDLIGTVGDDVLVGNDQINVALGNDGDDMLEGRGNDDFLAGGAGHDYIEAGDGNDYIQGDEGDDKIDAGAGDDNILGGPGDDIISAGPGNDRIEGGSGNDQLSGDSGNDVILGNEGNDTINGGAGNDVLDGESGNDVIDGSIGNDEIRGGAGNDLLFGGFGSDLLKGDAGDDIVFGDDDDDVLYGELGNDILIGGTGQDLLFGGTGKDVLFGGEGNDHLYGEIGTDYLVGGKGDDILNGGSDSDIYVFGAGDGQDVIVDAEGAQDIIRLANYARDEVDLIQVGQDLVLNIVGSHADKVTVRNQFPSHSIELLMFADGRAIDLTTLQFNEAGNVTFS